MPENVNVETIENVTAESSTDIVGQIVKVAAIAIAAGVSAYIMHGIYSAVKRRMAKNDQTDQTGSDETVKNDDRYVYVKEQNN